MLLYAYTRWDRKGGFKRTFRAMLTSLKRTLKCDTAFYISCHFSILVLQSQIAQVTQLLGNTLCDFRIGVKICVTVRVSYYHFSIAVKPTNYPRQRRIQDFFPL